MESIRDFEDMLTLLDKQRARHLIVGGLAFTCHAKPRYTEDTDIQADPAKDNVARVNREDVRVLEQVKKLRRGSA